MSYVVIASTTPADEAAYGPIRLSSAAFGLAICLRGRGYTAQVLPLSDPVAVALGGGAPDEFEAAVDQLLDSGLMGDARTAPPAAPTASLLAFPPRYAPDGCGSCGLREYGHFERWTTDAGWHGWIEPSDAQRLERMRARRQTPDSTTAAPDAPETADISPIHQEGPAS